MASIRTLETAFEFDPDFGVYLWLLAVAGCRRGEACARRWTDIHWDPAEIAISRSIAQVDQRRIEKDTKTHQGRRVSSSGPRGRLRGALLAGGDCPADAVRPACREASDA